MSTAVKFCGITTPADAALCVEAGAALLGFNFWPKSKRYVTPDAAAKIIRGLPPGVVAVGLFVNASPAEVTEAAQRSGITVAQLHGDEVVDDYKATGLELFQVVRLSSEQAVRQLSPTTASRVLVDSLVEGYGGAGKVFDWGLVDLVRQRLSRNVFVAGGLTPENVGELIRRVRPSGVDVASGVESSPGRKDGQKLRAFVAAVRDAEGT